MIHDFLNRLSFSLFSFIHVPLSFTTMESLRNSLIHLLVWYYWIKNYWQAGNIQTLLSHIIYDWGSIKVPGYCWLNVGEVNSACPEYLVETQTVLVFFSWVPKCSPLAFIVFPWVFPHINTLKRFSCAQSQFIRLLGSYAANSITLEPLHLFKIVIASPTGHCHCQEHELLPKQLLLGRNNSLISSKAVYDRHLRQ